MNFSITAEYSLWFIPVCFLAALLLTYLLYRKRKGFDDAAKWKVRLLFVLRFIFIFFISTLLLSPLFKSIKQNIQKPIIIIAQDNSSSIIINKDSSFYKNEYPIKFNELLEKLRSNYEVKTFSFADSVGEGLIYNFDKKLSNYSKLLDKINQLYSNRNVGALILAGDGIYNKGSNPIYKIKDIDFPIYTVALGDTGVYRDIAISEVACNKIAFLGNKFPVRVFAEMKKLDGITSQFRVIHNNQLIYSKNITAKGENYNEEIDFEIEAGQIGVQHYYLSITPVDEEINIKNNNKDIVVEVIDGKQKILLLSHSPHPDVAAIKYAMETNENFELDIFNVDKFTGNESDYNLVILHQLPSTKFSLTNTLKTIFNKKVPVLFILGEQLSIKDFNNLGTGFSVLQSKSRYEESTALFNKDFVLFTNDEETEVLLSIVPPLITPFGDYKIPLNSDVLAYQKIKNIETSKPLIAFSKFGGHKIGVISGEGIWRWRIYDYVHNSTQDNFDVLLNKIFQYLALKVKKEKFIVNFKNIYSEVEPVLFNAELYNENYELINEPEVRVEIENIDNKKFSFVFSKSGNSYRLNAGNFPAGDYSFKAFTKIKDEQLSFYGNFTVLDVNIESLNTFANHKLMYQLAENSNGKMFSVSDLDKIYDEIINNENIIPVSYSEKNLTEVINIKLLFFLLILFITVEWFLRKYFGNY